MNKFTPKRLAVIAVPLMAVIVLAIGLQVSAAGFFGAVYTTLGDGTTVNANVYDAKEDVYLNGGPQNPNANGLPDGTYYYQVTNPSGSQLLSSDDAVCRQLHVVGGVISGAVTSGTIPECMHMNGALNPVNGATPVQLIPYDDTDNPGGEYKVWLIRQGSNTSIDKEDGHIIHFRNNDAKTDNFKVVCKNCVTPTPTPAPDFAISGMKFYDINGDGIKNGTAPYVDFPLQGVLIRSVLIPPLNVGNPIDRLTLNDGTWMISGIPNLTEYHTWEVVPNACNAPAGAYWQQTAPADLINPPAPFPGPVRGYEGTLEGLNVTDLDFGNRCVSAGSGGLTLGYWSNKNGTPRITSADITALNAFCLRVQSGADAPTFTYPQSAKGSFAAWLLSGNATNMAYMLSVQMAASYLNTTHGLDGNALIDSGGEIGTLNGWITEASSSLCNFPITLSGHPQRNNQERLKNIFDRINNNNFVFIHTQCTACYPQ